MDDQPIPRFVARVAGGVLFLAGLAATSQLVSYWSNPTWIGRPWVRLAFYAVAGVISLVAVVQGLRMVAAHRDSDIVLPRHLLAFGAVLLVLTGAAQVVLLFLLPTLGSLHSAISIGIGGTLAAVRLWKRRRTNPALPADGA